ncbi:MAG: collagen-binding domain-containing protein [Pseudomonadota bacterium]|nr:collagen-binding domain-containing protein [Pseudomonadota bacterium]
MMFATIRFGRAALFALGVVALPAAASAAALDATTLMSQFALISLGDADTTGVNHIEGRSYVGGDMTATGFYSNSDGGPDVAVGDVSGTQIVGGDVLGSFQAGGSGSIVVGGAITGSNTSGRATSTGVGADVPGGVPVQAMKDLFTGLSAELDALDGTGAYFSGDMNSWNFYSGAGDANGLAVLNLTSAESNSILSSNGLLNFHIDAGVTLVINVESVPATINAKANTQAPSVLFNFAAATSLVFGSQAFESSILAPLADFSSPSGGTRGSMVVGSMSDMKGEIRSFTSSISTFDGDLSSVDPAPPVSTVPLPAPALLLLAGLGALGAARARRAA